MNTGADAADQIVRMTLNGVEVAAKITGTGAKELAVLLYAILKDQKKTAGKTRLTSMLKSGKELRVFAVKTTDLEKFCKEAKKYGVLYCVLKDKDSTDGLTDIMVRAEDASKINRIFERFQLATVDIGQIQQELDRVRTQQEAAMHPTDFRSADGAKQLVDTMLQPAPEPEEHPGVNPTMGPVEKVTPSEPLSVNKKPPAAEPVAGTDPFPRTSIRKELNRIKQQQRQKPPVKTGLDRKNPVQNRPVHREMPPRVKHKKER